MRIVIDATNLRDGGGVTHLTKILNFSHLSENSFTEVLVLGSKGLLTKIHDKPHIIKVHKKIFEKNFLLRSLWLFIYFDIFLKQSKADILFSPGGNIYTSFHPVVTMSRNSLPLELSEARRYGFSFVFFRLFCLRILQKRSFLNSDGFIFLNTYAEGLFKIQGWLDSTKNLPITTIIPHGVTPINVEKIISQSVEKNYFECDRPFRIIYVSIIDVYKHHDKVVKAIEKLIIKGLCVEINFVGPYYRKAYKNLMNIMKEMTEETKSRIKYHGKLTSSEQAVLYSKMDCVLFASSCENMPNILLEGMSSGLPIAASNRGPMPEILKSACLYFNPESVDSICEALEKLYSSRLLRANLAHRSLAISKNYSWKKCSKQTFEFLTYIAKKECVV